MHRKVLGRSVRPARVDHVDTHIHRSMDTVLWDELVSCSWIQRHQNALILGPCGIGKSYIASALANKAASDGYFVVFISGIELVQTLALAAAAPNVRSAILLNRIAKADLLIVDDFHAVSFAYDYEQIHLTSILNERQCKASTLLTIGLPPGTWCESLSPSMVATMDSFGSGASCLSLNATPCPKMVKRSLCI